MFALQWGKSIWSYLSSSTLDQSEKIFWLTDIFREPINSNRNQPNFQKTPKETAK